MDVRKRRNRSRFGRLLAFLAAAVVVVSCEAFIAQESEPYRATELPEDVTELFEVHGGDPNSGTVWIYEQGGPIHELEGDYESFSAYPGHRDIHFVQPHQTLTLNADLAARAGEYTLTELQAEVDVKRGDPAPNDPTLSESGETSSGHRSLLRSIPHHPISVAEAPGER